MNNKKWTVLGIVLFVLLTLSMTIFVIISPSNSRGKVSATAKLKITKVKDDPNGKRHAVTIHYTNTSKKPLTSLYAGIDVAGAKTNNDYVITGSYNGDAVQLEDVIPENQFLYKIDDIKPGQSNWMEIYLEKNTSTSLRITGFLAILEKDYSKPLVRTTTVELKGK